MADYFLSDVHLRHDRPDRGRRLARLVDRLGPGDPLVVVGDLVDFWLATRQGHLDPMACAGLRSLADFRARGGRLTLLGGNHDGLLGDYYRRTLGADWVDDALALDSHGLRLHLAHGHRLGTRSAWKAAMESRAFARGFASLPGPVAVWLDRRLERSNVAERVRRDPDYLRTFRLAADRLAGSVDLVVLGHVHVTLDDREGTPRLVVLGGWHARSSYLRVDGEGARLIVERDETPVAGTDAPGSI